MRLFFPIYIIIYPSYCLKWIASGRLHVPPIRRVVEFKQKKHRNPGQHTCSNAQNVGSVLGRKWLLDHFAWMPPKVAMLLCPGDFQQIQTINQEGTSINQSNTSPPNNKTETQLKNHFNKSSHLKILLKESSESVHRFNLPGPRYRCLTGRLYSRSQDFILNLIPLEVSPPRWCVSQPRLTIHQFAGRIVSSFWGEEELPDFFTYVQNVLVYKNYVQTLKTKKSWLNCKKKSSNTCWWYMYINIKIYIYTYMFQSLVS